MRKHARKQAKQKKKKKVVDSARQCGLADPRMIDMETKRTFTYEGTINFGTMPS
jgi:hypothetical protein